MFGHKCMLCASLINGPADPGCRKDLDFFAGLTVEGHSDRDVKQRLQLVAESGFRRVSYTEAIEILQKALQDFKPSKKGEKLFPNTDVEVSLRCCELKPMFCHWVSFSPHSSDFGGAFMSGHLLLLAQQAMYRLHSFATESAWPAAMQVTWGIDMSSEHERYLSEKVFGGPVIVYNYPKAIKVSSLAAHRSSLHLKQLPSDLLAAPDRLAGTIPHVMLSPRSACLGCCSSAPRTMAGVLLHAFLYLLVWRLDSWCLLAGVLHA